MPAKRSKKMTATAAIKSIGYPGSKFGAGVYQSIINEFPPHNTFIEIFGGSAAISKIKRPAEKNIIVEINTGTVEKSNYPRSCEVINDCIFRKPELITHANNQTLIYLDPPYMFETRKKGKKYYENELTDEQHVDLSKLLHATKALVAISCYDCSTYENLYFGWRKINIPTRTRSGNSIETVYFNYPVPVDLHEYTFLGKNKSERQQIKRKINRLFNKLNNLPTLEKKALIASLQRSLK